MKWKSLYFDTWLITSSRNKRLEVVPWTSIRLFFYIFREENFRETSGQKGGKSICMPANCQNRSEYWTCLRIQGRGSTRLVKKARYSLQNFSPRFPHWIMSKDLRFHSYKILIAQKLLLVDILACSSFFRGRFIAFLIKIEQRNSFRKHAFIIRLGYTWLL